MDESVGSYYPKSIDIVKKASVIFSGQDYYLLSFLGSTAATGFLPVRQLQFQLRPLKPSQQMSSLLQQLMSASPELLKFPRRLKLL
jgi:hypothetical protein